MLLKSDISAAKKKMKNIYNRKRQEEKEKKKRQEADRENNFYRKMLLNQTKNKMRNLCYGKVSQTTEIITQIR